MVLWNKGSIFNGFRDIQWRIIRRECDAMVNVTTKVKVIHFGTDRFLIIRL